MRLNSFANNKNFNPPKKWLRLTNVIDIKLLSMFCFLLFFDWFLWIRNEQKQLEQQQKYNKLNLSSRWNKHQNKLMIF